MKARLADRLRALLARVAPRCIAIVIFGDGSFLAAKFSRLEPALARIEIESDSSPGAGPSTCELVVNLGSVRIYRHVERLAYSPRRVTNPTHVN
ncbi:MAG TPA: hypothetical protein VNJ52_13540 [Patescibacteria group bacterium]|nr:hypothetical protein [Patescibacteria group bacterium]